MINRQNSFRQLETANSGWIPENSLISGIICIILSLIILFRMRKVFISFCLSTFLVASVFAQSNDTIVTITGAILKAQDSTNISGNILYEKLPYYDDMGMISVDENGTYSVQLVKGETYNFSVSKPGFNRYEAQVDITGDMNMNIYVEEDIVELRKLEKLIFGLDSDRISSQSFEELDDVAQWMTDNPTIVIQLEGHTDFGGNAEAALRLSQARVEAVKEYLIEKKIKKNRIFTKAFGGTQPVTQERTPEARALNRRVELRVIRR